jgi:glycosyltransferase involved in cell wall biosynthesis
MSLSVLIPVWNEEAHIAETIERVAAGLSEAPGLEAEIIVVDDGSTDATAARARDAIAATGVSGQVVSQQNCGRLAARRAALALAGGSHVLFLDSRIELLEGSVSFVYDRVARGEEVWNAHVHIATEGNPYGRFWRVLTEAAFSDYFADPRTTSFDVENFDRFPKGTTCFLAPSLLMREAFAQHTTVYDDERSANDDTPILRWVAARTPISISPSFACIYQPRTTMVGFVRHAFHRGIVFLDGHRSRRSRFFPLVVGFYPLSVAAVVGALWRPRLAVTLGAGGICGLVAIARRRGFASDSVVFGLLAPVYAVAHGAGMWRGALLAARSRFGR